MLTSTLQDLRHATRLLWRSPGFAAICIATVALAIGANTAIFAVVHGVMLKALPFAEPARLVILGQHTSGGDAVDSTTPGNLYDWMSGATAFSAVGGFAPTERIVLVAGGAERLRGGLWSARSSRCSDARPPSGGRWSRPTTTRAPPASSC